MVSTKTKKIVKTKPDSNLRETKINKEDNTSNTNYFITQSRLNRGQRKYCHCIMKLRSNKKTKKQSNNKSHYPICKKLTIDFAQQFKKDMKLKENEYNPYLFDVNKTNCVMNYDYSKYPLKDIQSFCQEKGIPISFTSKGKEKKYSKDKLVEKLVKNYLTSKLSK